MQLRGEERELYHLVNHKIVQERFLLHLGYLEGRKSLEKIEQAIRRVSVEVSQCSLEGVHSENSVV